MDYSTSASAAPSVPPLPRQSSARQHHSRRKEGPSTQHSTTSTSRNVHHASSSRPNHTPAAPTSAPASGPDVISSLITSLDLVSKQADSHLDRPSKSLVSSTSAPAGAASLPGSPPKSPVSGSFGVDYGAFRSIDDTAPEEVSLDELAACPPVIRTAKPPSGFSPLTAPKSPKDESSSGLKSLLGGSRSASRPSSKGSQASRDADTQSIGNLSVERGSVPPIPELKKQRSHDSWGKKQGRSHKGLMYMSSRERLREKEEKKRASIGAVGGGSDRLSTGPASPRQDPFLAETPISEEPSTLAEAVLSVSVKEKHNSTDSGSRLATVPRAIPTRDSSLRKTGSGSKRSSGGQSSRRISKRDSETSNAIPELEEQTSSSKNREASRRKNYSQARQDSDTEGYHSSRAQPKSKTNSDAHPRSSADMGAEVLLDRRARMSGSVDTKQHAQQQHNHLYDPKPLPHTHSSSTHSHHHQQQRQQHRLQHIQTSADEADIEEGAPSPAIAQGRRRDRSLDGSKRISGYASPDPHSDGGVRTRRSSSRMKRHSNGTGTVGGARSPTPDAANHVGYERPPSADSVDDAVESYLCSPRLSQKIRHPQTGRVISFSEVGDSEGSAVFCCVGMGLTRYITAFYDELALTLKLRLITPDRPGVGDSEPYLDGTTTPLSWPDDVYAICQALKITKFSILAHSAGAIYALATALRMPQHIRGRIHLLAPWIPPSQMSVFGASAQTPLPPTNAIPTSQRILRALPTPLLKAANSSFMTATSSSITSSLPKTPRKKRKSNANIAKEREKQAARDQQQQPPVPAVPASQASPEGNKENDHDLLHGDRPPGIPRKENTLTEEMDLVRPSHMSITPGPGGHGHGHGHHQTRHHQHPDSSASGAGHQQQHKKSPSTASAAHAAREAAVLAAAASALADRERQATYDMRLTHAIWELATTGANPAVDLLVCLERRHTIGFRYVDITRPVVIHHGSRDTRVPVENVRWLGKTMRRCEVRVLEGEGHGLMASAGVMGGVLMEMSKEWEDWGRLTGVGGGGGGSGGGRRDVVERVRSPGVGIAR